MTRERAVAIGDGGQASLLSLVVALVALVAATGLAVFVADSALLAGQRPAAERGTAVSLSERLVAADSPVTTRANVVDSAAVDRLPDRFDDAFPVANGSAVRLTLGGRTVFERGDPDGGTTIRRVVLVENRTPTTVAPPLPAASNRSVTLPRRTDRLTVAVDPPNGTTVTTVRVDGRVVLHDPSGIDGEYTVPVSRYETASVRVVATGPLPAGSVAITYYPATTRKAVLGVTVDA